MTRQWHHGFPRTKGYTQLVLAFLEITSWVLSAMGFSGLREFWIRHRMERFLFLSRSVSDAKKSWEGFVDNHEVLEEDHGPRSSERKGTNRKEDEGRAEGITVDLLLTARNAM